MHLIAELLVHGVVVLASLLSHISYVPSAISNRAGAATTAATA